jgi:hypothetical protein
MVLCVDGFVLYWLTEMLSASQYGNHATAVSDFQASAPESA